jgi:hypothetical protein
MFVKQQLVVHELFCLVLQLASINSKPLIMSGTHIRMRKGNASKRFSLTIKKYTAMRIPMVEVIIPPNNDRLQLKKIRPTMITAKTRYKLYVPAVAPLKIKPNPWMNQYMAVNPRMTAAAISKLLVCLI